MVILLIAGATGTRNRGVCCLVPRLLFLYSPSDFVVIVARDQTGLTEGSQTVFETPVFKHRGFPAVFSELEVIQWTCNVTSADQPRDSNGSKNRYSTSRIPGFALFFYSVQNRIEGEK